MPTSVPLPPAVLIIGPTASGKTGTACHLVDHLPVEIISVDSAMVFRDMNIGTAKPTADELARYPHRLIDVVSPEESYSAGRFRSDALAAMADIHARGKVPLLVGGTMLYVKALTEGLSALPTADPVVRAAIDAEAAVRGWPALYAELATHDPVAAARMEPTNAHRIQRALEVIRLTGRPMSSFWAEGRDNQLPARILTLALVPGDRSILHRRIEQRFDQMLRDGLIAEVEQLRAKYDLSPDLPSMRCVGYRQVWEMLDGRLPAGEVRDRGIFATRQLAKRQLTWLRSMTDVETIDCLAPDLESAVRRRVQSFVDNG